MRSHNRKVTAKCPPVPTVQVVHNGIAFDVPVGYATIQHYAATCRINLGIAQRVPAYAHHAAKYRVLIAKLEQAGL